MNAYFYPKSVALYILCSLLQFIRLQLVSHVILPPIGHRCVSELLMVKVVDSDALFFAQVVYPVSGHSFSEKFVFSEINSVLMSAAN